MNTLMGMGPAGWLVALVAGFVVGGLFFLSIKLQVEYVLKKQGPLWLVPACLYARLALAGVVLVVVAVTLPGEKIAAAMLAGIAGAFIARLLVARMVRNAGLDEATGEQGSHDA
jgi:hypothetical protein